MKKLTSALGFHSIKIEEEIFFDSFFSNRLITFGSSLELESLKYHKFKGSVLFTN